MSYRHIWEEPQVTASYGRIWSLTILHLLLLYDLYVLFFVVLVACMEEYEEGYRFGSRQAKARSSRTLVRILLRLLAYSGDT